MDSTKRIRCSNFSSSEMDILLTLVEEHKRIIECKKTDTVSNRDKDAEWEKLTNKFNAAAGSGQTAKQLRMKWDSWKTTTRKNYSLKKSSLYKTGGGFSNNSFDNWEERILSVVSF
ncbi:uncharacterized protein LOC111691787 [Anoplophora glabripennis]|uniref:uncharacterized protein LOC111691787 n=1 Tax=Anoplophora glabripennis TaxID=217634 RepID=UPI000A1332C7|nr:uncharacterized protein LOC111691787 [Anoplophora glabripennis]